MKKAVISDMDGLLLDSERITYEEYTKYLGSLGLEMPFPVYQQLLGKTEPQVRQQFMDYFGEDFPMDQVWDNVHRNMDDRMLNIETPVKKSCLDLLIYLKDHGYKTIVATSSSRSRVDKLLVKAGIAQYLDDSICGDEVSHGKPNPEIFLSACKKLGVTPADAIVMEDSEAGIMAAHNAKIDVYCVPDLKYPAPEYEALAAKVLEKCADVIPYL